MDNIEFSSLRGKYITKVDVLDSTIIFHTNSGFYQLYHEQDCCEHVYVEDVCGDVNDLVGVITEAEEVSNYAGPDKEENDSYTWTFYKVGTAKGSVTIRFYGTSNGYYSEEVSFSYTDNRWHTARGRMLSALSKCPERDGVASKYLLDTDGYIFQAYTEHIKKQAAEEATRKAYLRNQYRPASITKEDFKVFAQELETEDNAEVWLKDEIKNPDGTITHIIEVVSKDKEK